MSSNHDRHGQHIYGSVHKKIRKRWVPKVRAGLVHCWRCGRLIPPGAKWDLGHMIGAAVTPSTFRATGRRSHT